MYYAILGQLYLALNRVLLETTVNTDDKSWNETPAVCATLDTRCNAVANSCALVAYANLKLQ